MSERNPDGSLQLQRFSEYLGTRGKLDRIDIVPAESATSPQEQEELNDFAIRQGSPGVAPPEDVEGSGLTMSEQVTDYLWTLNFPLYDARFADSDLRAAISMAIDRDNIVLNESRIALSKATGWVSPVANGYRANGCRANCTYNYDKANTTLAGIGGYSGELTIAFVSDPDTAQHVTAICSSITNTLSIPCAGQPFDTDESMAAAILSNQMTSPFLTRQNMTYPSIQDFLVPNYSTGGAENWSRYSNPFFDAAVNQAATLNSKESLTTYQNAEKVLAADMPSAPLWFETASIESAGGFGNVGFTPFSQVNLLGIEQR